jgi:hypothetical protein
MGIGLGVALLLLAAGEARGGSYAVAQCGWGAGADADWGDSTGGAKFRPDGYCAGGDGDHLKSLGREDQGTVSGTRFARWHWVAPPTTSIRAVRGTWWHVLHDGFEQRLGGANDGGFDPFLSASGTDTAQREFSHVFASPVSALEDRLLCARGEDRWCTLDPGSWSGLRGLTLTVDDGVGPGAWIAGEITEGGWRHGIQAVSYAGYDAGSGVRFGDTIFDRVRVGLAEYPCDAALIEGELRARRMRPCPTDVSGALTIDTRNYSDGPHAITHCTADFGGNVACAPVRFLLVDNNPPAGARSVRFAGGDGWRRANDFDLAWENPDPGAGSPIWGAYWRLVGPSGFDTGVRFAPGRDIASLSDLSVPVAGSYSLALWLRDEADNAAGASAVVVPLRFDDVAPGIAFVAGDGAEVPEQVRAVVVDAHSGPAGGALLYRRVGDGGWAELPTKLSLEAGKATLAARLPELAPGAYVFRAEATDGAGNVAATSLRADGTEMAIRKLSPPAPPPPGPQAAVPRRGGTRLFARLRGGRGRGRGDALTVPFGAPALLGGRLVHAGGAGIGGRQLRVVSRRSRGALAPVTVESVETGERGGFELRLEPGPSRRIAVFFPGDGGLAEATRRSLELRVRTGISLRVEPQALRTGQTARLSGRVSRRGAPLPRRGKLVAIQYLETATGRWRPVLVTRSDHAGRFRARYRFRYVEGSASIRLRATALAEERWPYAPGSSPPLTVNVSGR